MAETSAIEWTDSTWNPVTGCTRVSPGCAHCYIETTIPFRTKRRKFERVGTEETTGLILHPERLEQPLRWRTPRRVFVNSLSDLFHEEIPDEFIQRVFAIMALSRRHTFQVLTKRPERARELMRELTFERDSWTWKVEHYVGDWNQEYEVVWPLPNVWLGVSIENARYTWRADVLREIPAAVRFISAEPLLGSLFEQTPVGRDLAPGAQRAMHFRRPLDLTGIDWLIVGGESGGRQSRPMHPEWARELRDACESPCDRCSVDHPVSRCPRPAFFFKQWGSWSPDRPDGFGGVANAERARRIHSFAPDGTPYDGRGAESWLASTTVFYHGSAPKSGGRLLDGREWNETPQ